MQGLFLRELKYFLPANYSFDWQDKNEIEWMLVEVDELKNLYMLLLNLSSMILN